MGSAASSLVSCLLVLMMTTGSETSSSDCGAVCVFLRGWSLLHGVLWGFVIGVSIFRTVVSSEERAPLSLRSCLLYSWSCSRLWNLPCLIVRRPLQLSFPWCSHRVSFSFIMLLTCVCIWSVLLLWSVCWVLPESTRSSLDGSEFSSFAQIRMA